MYSRRRISNQLAFVYICGFLFDPRVTPSQANLIDFFFFFFFVLTRRLCLQGAQSSQFWGGSRYVNISKI